MNSIKFAKLAHDFVGDRLNKQDVKDLMKHLHNNSELLEYIAIEHTIYQIGLGRQKENDGITNDDILTIARNHYISEIDFSAKNAKDCQLNLYAVDTSDAWCVYVQYPPSYIGIFSSNVIIVSKADGTVRYSGSAYD